MRSLRNEELDGTGQSGSDSTGLSLEDRHSPEEDTTHDMTQESSADRRTPEISSLRLFSQRAIFWFTWLFTPLAGGLLIAANWRRLGHPRWARRAVWVTGGITVLCCAISVLADAVPILTWPIRVLSLGMAFAARNYAEEHFGEHLAVIKNSGGRPARVIKPVLITGACLLALTSVMALDDLEAERNTAEDLVCSGYEYELAGDYESALYLYRRAHSMSPDEPGFPFWIADAFRQMGQLDSALVYFRMDLAMDPESSDSHFGLGLTYFEMGEYTASLEEIERAEDLGALVLPEIKTEIQRKTRQTELSAI